VSGGGANAGVLAIWNNCAPGAEAQYEHWYRSEHLAERVAIEGFVAGWRYEAVDGTPRYFTHFETTSPQVLFSEAYLARVNDPTPLTRRVMSELFTDMSRTVCERALRLGDLRGAWAAVLRYDAPQAPDRLRAGLAALAGSEAVLRAELWLAVDTPAPAPSAEQRLRGADATIAACVLLECTTEDEAHAAARAGRGRLPAADDVGVYRMLCSLHRADQGAPPGGAA
jgi:hypothetical protein